MGGASRARRVLRAHDVSVHVLHVLDALVQLGRGRDHRAANLGESAQDVWQPRWLRVLSCGSVCRSSVPQSPA